MLPPQSVEHFPSKCINPQCHAPLYKGGVVGIVPKILSFVSVVYKCRYCLRVFGYMMPVFMVSDFVEFLPEDPEFKMRRGNFVPKNKIKQAEADMLKEAVQTHPLKMLEMFKQLEEESKGDCSPG